MMAKWGFSDASAEVERLRVELEQARRDLAALLAEADHSEDGLWRFWSDKAMALARNNDQLRAERDDLAARLQSIQQSERKYTAAKLHEAAKMRKGEAL